MGKTLRNRSKAYDLHDNLRPEFSITLFNKKYPLMSKGHKGFQNKTTKSGKTNFNKIFYADDDVKKAYISGCCSVLNMKDNASFSLGDDTSSNKIVDVKPKASNEAPLVLTSSEPEFAPDSIEAFKQNDNADEEVEDEQTKPTISKQERMANQLKVDSSYKKKDNIANALKNLSKVAKNYSRGGKLKGKSHAKGGIRMRVTKKANGGTLNGQDVEDVELEDGEYVMSKPATQAFQPQLEKMNKAGNDFRSAPPHKKNERQSRIDELRKKFKKGGKISKRDITIGNTPATRKSKNKIREEGIEARKKAGNEKRARTRYIKKDANAGMGENDFDAPARALSSTAQTETVDRGAGLDLGRDDGIEDESMFPSSMANWFERTDFSKTLAYIKNKNRKVEQMGQDQLKSRSQEIAGDLRVSLKYNGNNVSQLKAQLYELMTLKVGKGKTEKDNRREGVGQEESDKKIGAIVDIEDIFGNGSSVNKDEFVKKYMDGGKLKTDKLKQDFEKPAEGLNKIVDQGLNKATDDASLTIHKPESQDALVQFNSMANKDGTGNDAVSETSYKRKTFSLSDALLNVEGNWRHRYAQKMDAPTDEYEKESIFRIRKTATRKGIGNLL